MSTTREQFEAWFSEYHDTACREYGGMDCTDPKGIAEAAWDAAYAAGQREMQARCVAVVGAPHWKPAVRNELRIRAEEIDGLEVLL